tara:strand:- start:158 stop:676 length:519 start_codon:yes stop_codon:yes gene_type:complete
MAGILPMAIHNCEIYFLFGRERRYPKHRDSEQWSDFGGAADKGETKKDTAIREGHEETNGFIGDIKMIEDLVTNYLFTTISTNNYTTYIINIEYDDSLPEQFSQLYDNILENEPQLLLQHSGKYEKDMARWVKLSELHIFKKKARRFYQRIINDIILYFKYIKKFDNQVNDT